MELINGKSLAKAIEVKLKAEIEQMPTPPGLAVILVGEDKASHLYVKLKEKACKRVGIPFHKYYLEPTSTKEEIIQVIDFLNTDHEIDGILVQLPLPHREWEDDIIEKIMPSKDVDGFHKKTIGNLLAGKDGIKPGLAEGIVLLIKSTEVPLPGKAAAILCNNEIFAEPIRYLLQKDNISVNTYSPSEENLAEKLCIQDIIIVAIGEKGFVTSDMIKENAIVIDVGINRDENGIYGDVDTDGLASKKGFITPVPGGVGPMTVAMLLKSLYEIKQRNT